MHAIIGKTNSRHPSRSPAALYVADSAGRCTSTPSCWRFCKYKNNFVIQKLNLYIYLHVRNVAATRSAPCVALVNHLSKINNYL